MKFGKTVNNFIKKYENKIIIEKSDYGLYIKDKDNFHIFHIWKNENWRLSVTDYTLSNTIENIGNIISALNFIENLQTFKNLIK